MPAQAKTYVQPRIAMQRPPLPIEHANPHIKTRLLSLMLPIGDFELTPIYVFISS